MKNKIGIVICTRTDSNRVPNKPFRKINGVPCIEHLIQRLSKTNLPIYLAYPKEQHAAYAYLFQFKNVFLYPSNKGEDPLARMVECAEANKLTAVIRVTHDKILVEEKNITAAITAFNGRNLDYLYSSKFVPGSGFEIISYVALKDAANKFKNVEHISYAIRAVTNNSFDFDPKHPRGQYRFLIDFPEDLKLLEVIFSRVGNDCTLLDALKYVNENPELKVINQLPLLTIYTCAFNAQDYIERCMESIERQRGFAKCEYIIVDDHSTDKTTELIAKFALKYNNVSWIRNEKNIGLASSCNVALKNARGKYIMRLDADDFFVPVNVLNEMLDAIQASGKEAIYPANYFGDYNKIQLGQENHHVGGAMFEKRAVDHIKFTEGLRGYEGLDFFVRAKDQLKIGYLDKPLFFYTQRSNSMSKTNLNQRAKIKKEILENCDA